MTPFLGVILLGRPILRFQARILSWMSINIQSVSVNSSIRSASSPDNNVSDPYLFAIAHYPESDDIVFVFINNEHFVLFQSSFLIRECDNSLRPAMRIHAKRTPELLCQYRNQLKPQCFRGGCIKVLRQSNAIVTHCQSVHVLLLLEFYCNFTVWSIVKRIFATIANEFVENQGARNCSVEIESDRNRERSQRGSMVIHIAA